MQTNYFSEWKKYMDIGYLNLIADKLMSMYSTKVIYPAFGDVFKAFNLCNPNDLKVIILSQDPYSDGRATGIAFANDSSIPESDLSPSLKVIKESIINYEIPHINVNFDNTLESWCSQGILLLNSALTVERSNPASHLELWRPFISSFIQTMSKYNPGIVYLLLGKEAQSFKDYISDRYNEVILEKHPSWYARTSNKMGYDLFPRIAHIVYMNTGYKINWYGNQQEDKECY